MIALAVNVAQVVALHDPFFDLGFSPAPTLAECLAAPIAAHWLPISRRGHAYDLGRFRYFIEVPSLEPLRLLWCPGALYLCDGRHRLGAAWLAGREQVPALILPWPTGEPAWCE